ncbi:MAG: O-antigen ligase family protein [Burkholderiaceae bacterium]
MDARFFNRPALLLCGLALLAVLTGLAVSWLEPQWAVASIFGVAAVSMVLYDYRIGVVFLTLMLPWFSSPLIPQARGFDLINFLVLASIGSLAVRRGFGRASLVPLPRVVRWCYLLPIAVAAVVAVPNLPIGAANFPAEAPSYYQAFATDEFLKTRVIKPMFFLVYAFLVANAVRDSARAERLLLVFGCSAVLPALAIIITAVAGGGSVDQRGTYLQGLGLHPNAYGMQLALAAGPLLFLATGATSGLYRWASAIALGLVSVGLLFTGSRGAAVAYIVVIVFWLFWRRRLSDFVVAAILAALVAVAVPEKVWDRLALGLDDTQATDTYNMDDPLTKGRLASWALLAPDILISPVWGQGIGSVAWNKATTSGRYRATLAHNMYLDILLDMGIAGFATLMYLYYRYASEFRLRSSNKSISPSLRDYFAGALASFVGMLVMGFSNGVYMPQAEQAFLWFSLGMLFANWNIELDHKKRRVEQNLMNSNIAS